MRSRARAGTPSRASADSLRTSYGIFSAVSAQPHPTTSRLARQSLSSNVEEGSNRSASAGVTRVLAIVGPSRCACRKAR